VNAEIHPPPEGNYYNKYETKNPIAKKLMSGFFDALVRLLGQIDFENLHEAGCGEGYVAEYISKIYPNVRITASDLSRNKITEAKARASNVAFSAESIYRLPYSDNAFDLVVASEVLEHLEQPENALKEILRVSNEHILVSVPNEPIWRICNMVRGKYVGRLGNTPGHIQHWSKNGFIEFIERHCSVIDIRLPFPWIMLLCRKK
jgi:2-polyprenyl-3-methyl-5-hydroxy-6-metoxy-1,4-benzoquinol methylase